MLVTSFYFFLFFFKFYFIFKLYIIVLVLPNIKMNLPQVYMCSPSWTLLPPPSPFHPSMSSQCTSPKHPVLCIEPGLATRFIHDILNKLRAESLQSCPILCNPWTVAHQAPLSLGFFKNTGVGCHALLQGIFPAQGSNPNLLCLLHWQAGSLPWVPPGKLQLSYLWQLFLASEFKM